MIRLRPFTPADAPKLLAMSHEPSLQRWLPDQVYRNEAHALDVASALAAFTAQPPDPRVRPYVLGIELDGELVGHVGLSPARGSVEVGYAVEARMQGRGIATAAVRAMLGLVPLPEVLGIVGDSNVASCRVLENAGFVKVSTGVYCWTRPSVRLARADDVGAIAELQRRWQAEDATIGFVAATAADIGHALVSYFVVAERDGAVVGFAHGAVRPCAGEAIWRTDDREYFWLENIYVDPEARSLGLGTAMFRALESAARAAGVRRLLVYSSTRDTHRMLRFYERLGLTPWNVMLFR